jgi:hypothetical protein
MKNVLAVALCFLAFGARCQNKAENVKEVNVFGTDGKTIIAKLKINASGQRDLFLIKAIRKRDSLNNYVSIFYFGNKTTGPVANMRIVLRFDKPVVNVKPSFTTAFNNMSGLSADHLTYLFKAGRLERDSGSVVVISFSIQSKEKIITEISGLDGILQ